MDNKTSLTHWTEYPRMYKREIIGKRIRRTLYKEAILGISNAELTSTSIYKFVSFKLKHQTLGLKLTQSFILYRCHTKFFKTKEEGFKELNTYRNTLYKQGYMTLEDLGIQVIELPDSQFEYLYKGEKYSKISLALIEAFNY